MRLRILLLVALNTLMFSDHIEPGGLPKAATVRIILVDCGGHDLGQKVEVEEFRDVATGGPDAAHLFRQNIGTGVPFGTYRLRVRTTGFWSAERQVRVYQNDVWVVETLELGMGAKEAGLPTSALSGRVKGLEQSSSMTRVRIAGVYSSVVMDTMTNSLGEFKFDGIPNGYYLAAVIRDGEVLDLRSFRLPQANSQDLVIDLSKGQSN
jgi:hypothetical protein